MCRDGLWRMFPSKLELPDGDGVGVEVAAEVEPMELEEVGFMDELSVEGVDVDIVELDVVEDIVVAMDDIGVVEVEDIEVVVVVMDVVVVVEEVDATDDAPREVGRPRTVRKPALTSGTPWAAAGPPRRARREVARMCLRYMVD